MESATRFCLHIFILFLLTISTLGFVHIICGRPGIIASGLFSAWLITLRNFRKIGFRGNWSCKESWNTTAAWSLL